MLGMILNLILFRRSRVKKFQKQFLSCLESEVAEEFLEVLLKLMSLFLCLNKDFKRNIKGFNARYLFRNRNNEITQAAIFKNNRMKVREKMIDQTNITVTFKDGKTLMNYLLSPKPDILNAILKQEVTMDGNMYYLLKFAYMSKHLQLMLTGKV